MWTDVKEEKDKKVRREKGKENWMEERIYIYIYIYSIYINEGERREQDKEEINKDKQHSGISLHIVSWILTDVSQLLTASIISK
jgi:hypothetical protein